MADEVSAAIAILMLADEPVVDKDQFAGLLLLYTLHFNLLHVTWLYLHLRSDPLLFGMQGPT